MGDEDLVVAVRLCDTTEAEQPDPLCLRQEDLEKWRHFESLLRGMYQKPPDAISVTYLDDESDWVQVGSDAELSEAVRLAKQGGDILQLQVKRLDTEQLITFDNTDSSPAESTGAGHFVLYIPTTDPDGEALQPLVYPHPTDGQSSGVDGPKLSTPLPESEPKWLVYPHSAGRSDLGGNENCGQNPGSKVAPGQGVDMQTALKNSAVGKDSASDRSPAPVWEGAAGLSAEDKLKFMMSLIEMRSSQKTNMQDSTKPEEKHDTEQSHLGNIADGKPKMVEPLCSEPGSLGKNFIPNQDPFEVDGSVAFFDHVVINLEKDRSPTLTPKRATNNKNEPNAKFFRLSSVETDGAASVGNIDASQRKQLLELMATSKAGQSTTQGRLAYTSALPKSKAAKQRTPVPMPRNLLMMEGAQSGANAVAIEITSESSDFFQGVAVNNEEEIAASGGAAASTSASEETGELMARGDSVASAVSREVKLSIPVVDVYAVSGDGTMPKSEKKVKRSSSKSKHTCSKKDKSADKKQDACIDGAKPRSSDKSEKRTSEHRRKPEDSAAKETTKTKETKKEEKKVKITEDVESGEKLNMKREATTLSRSDFAKYMKRTKKELHSAIVRDVSRMTETYFSKVVEKSSLEYLINDIFGIREPAFHEGVYCDGCNKEIYGIRYKCGNCLDFDLCSICENQPNLHDRTHVFLKLRTPAPRAGMHKGQRHSLLVENVYEAERLRSLVLSDTDNDVALDFSQRCSEEERPAVLTSPSTPLNEQEPASESSQNPSSPVDRENEVSSDGQDLDQTCVLSEKQLENPDSLKTCSITTVLSLKEIVESVPLTKLQPSTPCPARDHSEDAECDQQSPTPSDSSSSVVLVSPPAVTSAPAFSMASFDEDDMNDLPELISEETVKHLTAMNYDDGEDDDSDPGNSSSFEDMGSDSSDDFCVIDPPESQFRRFEYMVICSDAEEEESVQVQGEKVNPDQPVEAEVTSQLFNAVDTTEETEHNIPSSGPLDEAEQTDDTVQDLEGTLQLNPSSGPLDEAVMVEEEGNGGIQEEDCVEKEDNGLQGNVQNDDDEKQVDECSVRETEMSVDGLVHTMNEEEKARFAQLLRAEMDKEYEWELKRRAFELERELKLQKEKEFQLILEAKERAAAFENEKLEWVAQKKEEEGRLSSMSRQTSIASVSSLGSLFDDGGSGGKKDADCQTAPEPLSPASHIIQNVASGVSKAATTAFYTAKDVFYTLQAKQNEWKNASYNCKPPQADLRVARYSSQQSAEQADGLKPANTTVLPTAPVEETASPAAAVQSGDLAGNVTPTITADCGEAAAVNSDSEQHHGSEPSDDGKAVKALQRPVVCWMAPSTFKMPTSTWTPPKDDYIPPTSNWVPSKHEFIPPNIEWITTVRPGKVQGTAADAGKEGRGGESDAPAGVAQSQESSRRPSLTSSQKTPTFAALEIADTALRRELQGMQRLIEMGFANREKNRQLLNKFNNDLEKVVQSLLQEEGETEDSHWAFHRH